MWREGRQRELGWHLGGEHRRTRTTGSGGCRSEPQGLWLLSKPPPHLLQGKEPRGLSHPAQHKPASLGHCSPKLGAGRGAAWGDRPSSRQPCPSPLPPAVPTLPPHSRPQESSGHLQGVGFIKHCHHKDGDTDTGKLHSIPDGLGRRYAQTKPLAKQPAWTTGPWVTCSHPPTRGRVVEGQEDPHSGLLQTRLRPAAGGSRVISVSSVNFI